MFFRYKHNKNSAATDDAAEGRVAAFFWYFYSAAASVWPAQGVEEFCVEFDTAMRTYALVPGFTRRDVETAFRRLARKAHPDVGGNREAFQALVAQRDLLLSHADWASSRTGADGL